MFSYKSSSHNWAYGLTLVLITYFISHSLMIFVYGAWWDDMACCWNVSQAELLNHWEIVGRNPFMSRLLIFISGLGDLNIQTYAFRLFAFINWMISLIAFFYILKRTTLNYQFTMFASLIAASCCMNKCLFLISCFHYTMSICLFMLGLVAFVYDYYKRSIWLQLVYSLLWLVSLLIWRTAVLVIPVLIVIASFIQTDFNYKEKESYKKCCRYLFSNYYIAIISLALFAIIYSLFFKPVGDYTDYYSVKVLNISVSPITTVSCIVYVALSYIGELFSAVHFLEGKSFVLFFFLLLCVILFLSRFKVDNEADKVKSIFIISLVLLFFSIMPQMFIKDVKLTIGIDGYNSRLTSLLLFPLSVILAYLVCLAKQKYRVLLISVVLTTSIINSINVYLGYAKGWMRNESISYFLQNNSHLKGKKVKILNNALEFNANTGAGVDTYYEYEGCARYAYGFNHGTTFSSYYSSLEQDELFKPDYYLIILKNRDVPRFKTLFFDRFFNKDEYNDYVKNCLIFNLIKAEEWNTKK